MSPLSSNGSKLKVFTNVAGQIKLNEEYTREQYERNQQRETPRKAGSHPMDIKAFGRDIVEPDTAPVVETPTDAKLEAAIDADLTKRGVAKPKRKRAPRKKTQTTTSTTDKE